MGTRGTFGFRVNGKDKLSYNHFDSYPGGLGVDILTALREYLQTGNLLEVMKSQAAALKVVDEDTKPTLAQVKSLSKFADTAVSSGQPTEWYVLLRKLQGDILGTLEAGYIIDGGDFINDSLFCEWGYIVNLDDNTLEVYEGFQKKPHDKGRYSSFKPKKERGQDTYYACALIATFPLLELPTDDDFLQMVDPPEPEETQAA